MNQREVYIDHKDPDNPPKYHKSEEEWRKVLTTEQFRILREKGTEPPFSGKYYDFHGRGIFECAACGNDLFSSRAKFDSGSGWPSFYAPISEERLAISQDTSHGMRRIEVMCGSCDSHLGHVFSDGPQPTGLRYCINSRALHFVHDSGK
ncbi:MAG: peptide-methionine (R)-S-oxide reductase MsrB [Chitinivibrionales bacterium]